MINVIDPSKCCGCTACASICTHNAISMCPDNLGFLYPKTDMSKCVDCGLCDSVCTFNDNYDISLNFKEPEAFGVRHKNSFEVDTSRSGAAFIAFLPLASNIGRFFSIKINSLCSSSSMFLLNILII